MVLVKKKTSQSKTLSSRGNKSVIADCNKLPILSSENKKENVSEILITLKDINASEILQCYYNLIEEESNVKDEIQETVLELNKDEVTIGNLLHEKSKKTKRSIMFLDPHRGQIKFWSIMTDLSSNGPLPMYINNPCWWCRNKFSTHPIGCPIRYNCQKDFGLDKERVEKRILELNLSLDNGNDFFETEGVFCTFPCVKAYIIDQISRTKSSTYRKSLTLLTLLYLKLVGNIETIPIAGTWKLTTEWGGHMSPTEYRSSNGLLEYTETVNTKRPYMFCSSNLIKEKRLKQ
jgi:hypothetical protein